MPLLELFSPPYLKTKTPVKLWKLYLESKDSFKTTVQILVHIPGRKQGHRHLTRRV